MLTKYRPAFAALCLITLSDTNASIPAEDTCPEDAASYCPSLTVSAPCAGCAGTYVLQPDLLNQRPAYTKTTGDRFLQMSNHLCKWVITDTEGVPLHMSTDTTTVCEATSAFAFPAGEVVWP